LLTAFPRTKRHETWLRGAWPTDPNGVAQFTSKFHLQFSAHYQHPPYPQRSSQATTQAEQSMSTLKSFPVGQPSLMAPLSPESYCTRANSSSKMILMCRSTRSVWFYRSPLRLLPKCHLKIYGIQMHPYTMNPIMNTRGRTRNWHDGLNIFADSQGPEGKYDPVFKMHLLGGIINQGLIGYITMVGARAIS